MGSRGSADSDSGRGPNPSSSKGEESMESSSAAAAEGSEAQRVPRREGFKLDSKTAGPGSLKGKAQSGKEPLGLETR
jgi:hypothetical protein